ncbi:unnamed protein product [Ceutorhynchus assimilis]|uniref:Uncharacterized protein n=1 Tax=Ceutorhynchus assimilis TaxID=467358 RepID=A0A9N9MJ39_9CUCU|nr:unnamed protein product [Ceutorhynchus assimilis]
MKNSPEATLKPSPKPPVDEQPFSMFSGRAMGQIGAPMSSSPPVDGAEFSTFSEKPRKDTWQTWYKLLPKNYKPISESHAPKPGYKLLPVDNYKPVFDAQGRALRPILGKGEMLQCKQVRDETSWCPYCPHCNEQRMKKLQ